MGREWGKLKEVAKDVRAWSEVVEDFCSIVYKKKKKIPHNRALLMILVKFLFPLQVCELEGKNKKLIQDGECTRHNTEAARLHLEVKMKESEKELKRELAQALEATKNAERILQETKVKWQQETNAVSLNLA